MRASPACQVSLHRFGVWRVAILALAAIGIAALTAWLIGRPEPAVVESVLPVVSLVVLSIGLSVSLWHMPPQSLRWDGHMWHLGAAPGELTVAIDLGPWMLLRFTPAGERRFGWLPVQRRGLESQWHALRCAVYSPRPAPEV